MKRKSMIFSALLCLVFLLVSCFLNNAPKPVVGSTLIGITMPETHIKRWTKDGASLKKFAESKGYRAELSFAYSNQETQNQQIRNFITSGAKLIIVGCINEKVTEAVADAARNNVAVIAYDRLIQNSDDYDYYITFNNYKVGLFQGLGIKYGLNLDGVTAENPKYISLFAGSGSDNSASMFYDGAMEILNPYIEKGILKVVGPYPKNSRDSDNYRLIVTNNWDGSIARARMESLLENEAKDIVLDAVLAPNDTLARVIISTCLVYLKYSRGKLPLVTGQDAEADSIVAIKENLQYMTVFKDTTKLAAAAISLADQILKGNSNPVISGGILASGNDRSIGDTGKKIVKSFILEPIYIEKTNWNIPVMAGFYTPEEEYMLK